MIDTAYVFAFEPARDTNEHISMANGHAYQWGFHDACVRNGIQPPRVPDGWPFAWLEYVRRNPSRMAIDAAFQQWCREGTLPGVPTSAHDDEKEPR
jgi:hypothetical protein